MRIIDAIILILLLLILAGYRLSLGSIVVQAALLALVIATVVLVVQMLRGKE